MMKKLLESIEMSTESFELMKNDIMKIMKFFKESKDLFREAVKAGKKIYGKNGGYRPEDKYVVIDKEHPLGVSLYSTSDESVIDALKEQSKETVTEEVEDKEVVMTLLDVLKAHLKFYSNEEHSVIVKSLEQDDEQIVISSLSDEEYALLKAEFSEEEKPEKEEIKDIEEIVESVTSDTFIFDVLGIEEEERAKSGHLIAQYKELEKKFPKASIWLKGDVNVYVKGKVVGETADLSAVVEDIKESGPNSGNFKSGSQRHNDKMDKIFKAFDNKQQKFADFLLSKGLSKDEVEKLKQDSGLHGNPLQQKFVSMGGKLIEKVDKKELTNKLPKEVTINVDSLVGDDVDIESAFLDDEISDWLSDTYGFCHFGFEYDIRDDKVVVTNIQWDTSESLEEEKTLTEGAGNFRTNDIINLCSPHVNSDDFKDTRDEEKILNPELTDSELDNIVSEWINMYYNDMYEQVTIVLKEIEDFVKVKPGYHEGFNIEFEFDDGRGLAENFIYYTEDKEYAIEKLKEVVEDIKKALKNSIESGWLVGYDVAYRFSNGETGYDLSKNIEKDTKELEVAMSKLLKDGLEYIEEELITDED